MSPSEYIRPHSEPSGSHILTFSADKRPAAVLTFLHAGHSTWPKEDKGPAVSTEHGHGHPVYHAVLFTSGRNTMIHDGRIHECRRGTMVLTDPGCIHEYRPQSPGGASFIEITFDIRSGMEPRTDSWDRIMSHWLGTEVGRHHWPLNILPPNLELIESLMNDVVSSLERGDAFAEASAALAMGRFILELCRLLRLDEVPGDFDDTDLLEKAKHYLEQNFTEPLTVSELAEIACLSDGAFIRSFSARYGLPPMAYRKQLRITAAKHLLAVSGRSIGEIASNVGYGDIYAFSRTFKTEVGKTASQWRKDQT